MIDVLKARVWTIEGPGSDGTVYTLKEAKDKLRELSADTDTNRLTLSDEAVEASEL